MAASANKRFPLFAVAGESLRYGRSDRGTRPGKEKGDERVTGWVYEKEDEGSENARARWFKAYRKRDTVGRMDGESGFLAFCRVVDVLQRRLH